MKNSTVHGWLGCRKCFNSECSDPNWKLVHNPGYWGALRPSTLVLGFSKGQTQNIAAIASEFENVAFAGMRSRLAQALVALGILRQEDALNPDQLFRSQEQAIGFASLIRCSLLMRQGKDWVGSGAIMPAAAKSKWAKNIIANCINEHLVPLPTSASRVVLLGTTPTYMASVTNTISGIFPDFMKLNPFAFRAGGATWAFASHPSRANGHFNGWLSAEADSPLGRAREWARDALGAEGKVLESASRRHKIASAQPLTFKKEFKNAEMKKPIHPKPGARSKLVEQAEKLLCDRFELINSTAKVAGFKLPNGRELLLLREGDSLRVLTKPLSVPESLNAPKLYGPADSRNSNFKSCAPTLGPGHVAAQWNLRDFDGLQSLLQVAIS